MGAVPWNGHNSSIVPTLPVRQLQVGVQHLLVLVGISMCRWPSIVHLHQLAVTSSDQQQQQRMLHRLAVVPQYKQQILSSE